MLLDASALSKLVEMAVQVGMPVLSLFAAWLAHRLVKAFEDKTKIQLPAQTQAMIDDWVHKGVMYAEQKAQAAIDGKLAAIKGPDKLEMAANFVLDLASQHGYDALARDKVEKLIESKLGIMNSDSAPAQQ